MRPVNALRLRRRADYEEAMMARPQLNPPCVGWQRDLPGPNSPPIEQPLLLWQAPTHMDETYVEFARNTSSIRGVCFYFLLLIAWTILYHVGFAAKDIYATSARATSVILEVAGILLLVVGTILIGGWTAFVVYRAEVSPPRDLPLRFNRLRRKAYVYEFHSVWWNPFERGYVTTASYDWDDLRAEKWKVRGATPGGGLIIKEGVSIAVVKPGTNDVVARFQLNTDAANTSNFWAYVCAYMQNGIKGLDPDRAEPRDANDVAPYNIALRLAPRVQWPADMDLESRTAP
ncbi:DUF6708 domain-containing protein [Achromobacter mucicolens]|uniref:DUF6708 domain-containing protein n=1 Tax=Achromobacter mucicolens TaxID=1389922 RepID=UPI001F0B7306|nr:DUF6708 domain-containing protein [Achromobacter mucicolens]